MEVSRPPPHHDCRRIGELFVTIRMLKTTASPPHALRPSRACYRPAFSLSARSSASSVTSNPKKSLIRELQRQLSSRIDNASRVLKNAPHRLLDVIVDSTFKFTDQILLPSESNFAPVDEIGGSIEILQIEGEMPEDFPRACTSEMVPILSLAPSIRLSLSLESPSETLKIEQDRQKPCFLPAIEGDSAAIIAAYILNYLRFGKVNKNITNTNVFEHAGRVYAVAESHQPQEICIQNLETGNTWDIGGEWDRPFTAHPKVAPGSGELVIFGSDAKKPFLVVGVVSDDGTKLKHKVDLKLNRSTLCHDIGVTLKYNIIIDIPLTIDIGRLTAGGQLIEFEKEGYARIGIMPRYGDAESVMWFDVEPFCMFHLINCFEDGDEVVVQGLRSADSVIPGPRLNKQDIVPERSELTEYDKAMKQGINDKLFSRLFEWRLNLKTKTRKSTPKVWGFAKLCLDERENTETWAEDLIKMEIHRLSEDEFCSGASFVPRVGGSHEDDGWIISFVHNERTNTSQVHIIDTQKFEGAPVAKITLPQRVPYGFHGTFVHDNIHGHVNTRLEKNWTA
ncbi:hypothetical protein ZWY2020_039366 [Hordeum vulgare]|nr:hypothetical protein ZWY2020_039366 [Hordeum vulgare]